MGIKQNVYRLNEKKKELFNLDKIITKIDTVHLYTLRLSGKRK